MSAVLIWPGTFDLSDVLNKPQSDTMKNYDNNVINSRDPNVSLMDRKAVGTPARVGFSRRHSVTLPSSKYNQNLLPGLQVELSMSTGNNESKFRDRSFSDSAQRLLPKHNVQVNSSRYKTELCRPFEENGSCTYGDKCQFAHGIRELRSLIRHHKYKTELCRTFHTIGFCPYGPRCHFIHNEEERRFTLHDQAPLPVPATKTERPRLHHSFSFAGFPTTSGLLVSPTCATTPVFSGGEDLIWANNSFTISNQELPNLFAQTLEMQVPLSSGKGHEPSTLTLPPTSESPEVFEPPVSPPDSLSDQEGYLSSSSSGSGSPTLDTTKRLPIFSRLSIFDD
ncbi:mRNA decay activator protein ZFP36L1 [Spea bombifrons]|uniref:mRNA decay activator protein ZFP36L1 n=1 Tax=Spea bombifrons TaxID=233779 RepID=UPI002349EC96|nr:mRNA decay activator protein ZFP36L1 [Spea bombifrons]